MDTERLTEEQLIRRTLAGDAGAFAALCTRHEALIQARIRPWITGPIRRKVSVLDVRQETYLAAHPRLADIENRGEGAFGAWIAQIAEYKAREAVRRYAGTEKRDPAREVSRPQRRETGAFAGRGPTPSEVAQADERREQVERAIGKLPEDYRRVLRLLQVDRVPVDAAAALMGRSRQAVKKLYGRALAKLADLLDLGGEREGA